MGTADPSATCDLSDSGTEFGSVLQDSCLVNKLDVLYSSRNCNLLNFTKLSRLNMFYVALWRGSSQPIS